jgi:hypothetical protein
VPVRTRRRRELRKLGGERALRGEVAIVERAARRALQRQVAGDDHACAGGERAMADVEVVEVEAGQVRGVEAHPLDPLAARRDEHAVEGLRARDARPFERQHRELAWQVALRQVGDRAVQVRVPGAQQHGGVDPRRARDADEVRGPQRVGEARGEVRPREPYVVVHEGHHAAARPGEAARIAVVHRIRVGDADALVAAHDHEGKEGQRVRHCHARHRNSPARRDGFRCGGDGARLLQRDAGGSEAAPAQAGQRLPARTLRGRKRGEGVAGSHGCPTLL